MPDLAKLIGEFVTWAGANVPVAAALITAAVSALISLVTLVFNPFFAGRLERTKADLVRQIESSKGDIQKDIETHRAALADDNSFAAAKRAYEYEARKRLYEQIEPLMFQLSEAAEAAHSRVVSLVRTYRDDHLSGSRNWLDHEGYYLRSTVYRLILPVVFLRLIQRRMTFVDMSVDRSFHQKYNLLKMYAKAWTDDFRFARLVPSLAYDPDASVSEADEVHPEIHTRQGLYAGVLDNIIDVLVFSDGDGLRPKTFGEFEDCIEGDTKARKHLKPLLDMLTGFEPNRRPVAARLFQALGVLAFCLSKSFESEAGGSTRSQLASYSDSSDFVETIAWRKENADVDRAVAKAYALDRLAWERRQIRVGSLTA